MFSNYECDAGSMPLLFVLAGAVLGLLMCSRGHAANLIVNGDFTAGVLGWQSVGNVFDTGQTAVISDQGGARVVLFQTISVPVETTATLSLRFDLFAALSPPASLGQTPDSLFLTAFLGTVPFGNSFGSGLFDSALGLLDADFRGSANFASGLTSGASPKGPGWTRYQLALPVMTFVTIAFELLDGNAVVGDSTGAVDNVVLDAVPVPEPDVAMFIAITGMQMLMPRRRRAGASL